MSGFVGFLQRDGRPADPALLGKLAEALRFRGPDGLSLWHGGSIALGHARCVTDPARDGEPMPLALDDRYRICGHLRLDARDELVAALERAEGAGRVAPRPQSDAMLVLRAYRAYGSDCMTHVHGEFSFAVWDARERRLFCARDPFGARPFFYAAFDDLLLFGNTLDALRLHPRVSGALDEQAIADFLACGHALDRHRTFFRDLRRLPGGHWLDVTPTGLRQLGYWSLPDGPELRYRREEQYVEHLGEVLGRAVRDRAVPGTTALALSGGLDSGAIAAAAAGRLGGPRAAPALRAYCYGMNRVFEDREPEFARLSAAALEVPLDIVEAEDDVPFKPHGRALPEPCDDFYFAETARWQAHVARDARVLLDGLGGDEAFLGEWLLDEAARVPWPRLVRDALVTWARVGRPGIGLRAWRARGAAPATPRARARARLSSPAWPSWLEALDAGFTGVALENRWPFLDHRVLRFALSLPPLPWCVDKHLLRLALRPVLPAAIVARPKAPLAGQVFSIFLSRNPGWHDTQARALAPLAQRLDLAAWRRGWQRGGDRWRTWELARPIALARWLEGLESRQGDGGLHETAGERQEGRSAPRPEKVLEARAQ